MSNYIPIGPCPYCGTWAAQSYLDKLAETKAVVTASAPSPWHDASEKPDPARKCVMEYRQVESRDSHIWHNVWYWDAIVEVWRWEDGNAITDSNIYPRRWQYLDTSAALQGKEVTP